MAPINYLNTYSVAVLGSLGASLFGAFYCYNGMSQVSFMTYRGTQVATYYFDKGKYDFYLHGLIYCGVFAAALLLITFVIVIPSQDQVQRRMASSSFGGGMGGPMGGPMGAPGGGMSAPPVQQGAELPAEPADLGFELTPEIESFDDGGFSMDMGMGMGDDDDDVISGSGRITDESHEKFLRQHPESAVKFLLRKDMSGRPVSAEEEELFEGWQKRGLSRGKLRQQLFNLMDWEDMPDLAPSELVSEIQDHL